MPTPAELWAFLPLGFALSVVLELPVLLVGLSRRHPLSRRLLAAVWLTACTYPIVVLVLPLVLRPALSYEGYVAVAEIFAPLAECVLFWQAFLRHEPDVSRREVVQDMAAIVLANLSSWLIGAWLISRIYFY